MNLLSFPLLSITIWLPALGALLLLFLRPGQINLARWVALSFALVTFVLAGTIAVLFYTGPYGPIAGRVVVEPPLQFVDRLPWMPGIGSSYLVGIDGFNLWMLVLTAFLTPIAIAATWSRFTRQTRMLLVLLLVVETAFMGVFVAQDMLLFYVFFEAALVPMIFLVGMWGGHGRARAAMRLFMYTFAGSVMMLLGIIGLHILHRNAIAVNDPSFRGTFDLPRILDDMRNGIFTIDPILQRVFFGLFFAAFAIKMALWPFHTWLPDTYEAAPAPVAIMLAGVMSKFGAYGFIRFNLSLFPEVARWAAPAIGALAAIGLIYAAIVAFSQTDLQRVVAYASISHMNFIVLGIFALEAVGLSGALFQMVAHGVTTAAMLLVVAVLYERREMREISSFSGLWKVMPTYGGLTLLALLATMGLPGLISFVGELTIIQGVFSSPLLGWPYALAAVVGMILAAVYTLRIFRNCFMGDVTYSANAALADLNGRERLAMALLAVPMILGGLFPNLLFAPVQGTVQGLIQYVGTTVAAGGRLPF